MHIVIHKITDISLFSRIVSCLSDCSRKINATIEDDCSTLSIDLEDTDEIKIKNLYAVLYIGDKYVVIPKLKFWYMEIS